MNSAGWARLDLERGKGKGRGRKRERQVEYDSRMVKVLSFTGGSWFGGHSEGFSFLMSI